MQIFEVILFFKLRTTIQQKTVKSTYLLFKGYSYAAGTTTVDITATMRRIMQTDHESGNNNDSYHGDDHESSSKKKKKQVCGE